MYNFAMGAFRSGAAEIHHLWWQKDLTNMHPWQWEVGDPKYMWRITKELQDWSFKADAIVFQMLHNRHGLSIFRGLKDMLRDKGYNIPIISEIDDHMTSTPVYNPADEYYTPGAELREIALAQFKESDAMIVSTPYLKEVYSEFNDNIYVVPNALDFEVWDKVKPKSKGGIRIGWAGGANHDDDLKIMEGAIKSLTQKYKEVKFVLVHGVPKELRGLHGVEFISKWARIDRYPAFIGSLDFDIGIAPLVDNAFNRGKSNLRWLEYSALGIPTVASKVGHFAETIHHGQDGFLAEDNEFEKYLELLIENKSLRNSMGSEANRRVREDFNIEDMSKHYVLVVSKIIENKPAITDDFKNTGSLPEGVRVA